MDITRRDAQNEVWDECERAVKKWGPGCVVSVQLARREWEESESKAQKIVDEIVDFFAE